MANHQSAKKSIRKTEKRTVLNRARKNRIRSFVRKVEDAIASGEVVAARTAFIALEPEIMRGVTKKIFKLGTASRKLRRLAARIRTINTITEAKEQSSN